MSIAWEQKIARAFQPATHLQLPRARQGQAGTSKGINIAPGSDDDGWIVPEPVYLKDGTRLQLHKDGEALHAAFDAIQSAKHRVCMEMYIFHSDSTGRAFAELLAAKAKEGVQVYLIYDSFGSIDSDRKMFDQMWQAGVKIQVFHPIRPWDTKFGYRPVTRDHRKILAVDYDMAGLGGLNVGGEYAGSWVVQHEDKVADAWRDNSIGVRGPSARYLVRCFASMWNYVGSGGRLRRTEMFHNADDGEFGILASVPCTNNRLLPIYTRLFRQAKKSIQLTMAYFAPSDELVNELRRAAKRGVKVQLVLPGRTDVQLMMVAARSFYECLLNSGVEIYERQEAVLHAKTLVIDSFTTLLGSTNLDYRSIEYNCEISTIIRNAQFGAQASALFENDVKYSECISLRDWRRRPTRDRIVQWAVSRARYLL